MDFLEPAQQPIRQAIQNEESTQRAQQFAEVLEVIIDRNEKRIFLYNIYQDTREELLNYYIGAPKQNIYLPTGEYSIDKISWNPHWHPTARQKASGRTYKPPGHPKNPMGVVKMFLYRDGIDTLRRIHGTDEPEKIGQRVSSGCIRMRNDEAKSLAEMFRDRLPVKVIVK